MWEKREILETGDGSLTFSFPEVNEQYHSKHGALQEALHVFIQEGFHYKRKQNQDPLAILEMGFGTGLNAILTQRVSEEFHVSVNYTTLEAFPIPLEMIDKLNYAEKIGISKDSFLNLHRLPWEKKIEVSEWFTLRKRQLRFEEVSEVGVYDLIYFDAFGIRVQPHLWTEAIFANLFSALKSGGILVTYASNGTARRALQQVGFQVEKLAGPPGKKEMMRAIRPE